MRASRAQTVAPPSSTDTFVAMMEPTILHCAGACLDASHAGSYGRRHPDDTPLFAALAKIVRNTGQVLLVGPGSCKHEFVKFLLRNHPGAFEERIAGVESLNHLTDAQLVAI
ncbi:MAG: hypothetical protein ACKOEL_01370, partial [Planctomycetota bacterium]